MVMFIEYKVLLLYVIFLSATSFLSKKKDIDTAKNLYAVVTLVSGSDSPYLSGALALGQSLLDSKTKLDMVVMVTPDVTAEAKKSLSAIWIVREVAPYYCNHKHNLDGSKYDLNGEQYRKGVDRWSTTCTKFRAWQINEYQRIIFMDSDTLVVGSIDNALFGYSNASFLAAPESFPPDTFNSGFMVITPNDNDFQKIVKANEEIGSSEGGDQGILNRGLCPNWFHANSDDLYCGRLPWIYNVGAGYYDKYKTYQIMSKLPTPLVVHFVSEGKPWKVLSYEYYQGNLKQVMTVDVFRDLGRQAEVHLIWREKFFKQTGQTPSPNKLLLAAATGQPLPTRLSEIVITAPGSSAQSKKNINRKDNDNTKPSLIRKRREKAKKAEKSPKGDNKKGKKVLSRNKQKQRTDL